MKSRRAAIGDYRDRIRIERDSSTTDPIGGQTDGAATVVLRSAAKVTPMTGRERYLAQTIKASLSHLVELPFQKGTTIKPQDRVIWEGPNTTLQIISPPINVDGRDRWLQLECAESQ